MKTKFIINLSILLFVTVLNGCGRDDNTPIDTDGDGEEDTYIQTGLLTNETKTSWATQVGYTQPIYSL